MDNNINVISHILKKYIAQDRQLYSEDYREEKHMQKKDETHSKNAAELRERGGTLRDVNERRNAAGG